MYITTRDMVGTASALADPPTASSADGKVLAQAAKLTAVIDTTVQDVAASAQFLATSAQQDLLAEVVNVLAPSSPPATA